MSYDDFLKEFNPDEATLDRFKDVGNPEEVTIHEIREGDNGKNGMTVTFDFGKDADSGIVRRSTNEIGFTKSELKAEVKPTEVKEEVKIEEPVSTQKVKIPGTKQSKPIPLSDFTLGKEGERSFTKRVKKDEGGVSGVEPLNQFKLNQGMDSYGNPYPRVHVILDDADAEKYQAYFSVQKLSLPQRLLTHLINLQNK